MFHTESLYGADGYGLEHSYVYLVAFTMKKKKLLMLWKQIYSFLICSGNAKKINFSELRKASRKVLCSTISAY